MHIFHSREYIKTCIFTAVKIQDLICSRERNRKIGITFFYFLNKGTNSLWHICFFSKGNNYCVSYFYGNVNRKSESLRSLIKERAYIDLSATTRKSKQKLTLLFTLKDYGKFVDNKKKIQMFFVKYVFYFTHEVDNTYISFEATAIHEI